VSWLKEPPTEAFGVAAFSPTLHNAVRRSRDLGNVHSHYKQESNEEFDPRLEVLYEADHG
jgi:hypothetical protein